MGWYLMDIHEWAISIEKEMTAPMIKTEEEAQENARSRTCCAMPKS